MTAYAASSEELLKPRHFLPECVRPQSTTEFVRREASIFFGRVLARPIRTTLYTAATAAVCLHLTVPALQPSIQTGELIRKYIWTGPCLPSEKGYGSWGTVLMRDGKVIAGTDRAAGQDEIAACEILPPDKVKGAALHLSDGGVVEQIPTSFGQLFANFHQPNKKSTRISSNTGVAHHRAARPRSHNAHLSR